MGGRRKRKGEEGLNTSGALTLAINSNCSS